jgi:hypothetical protein
VSKPFLYRFRVPRADLRVMAALSAGEQQPWRTFRGRPADIARSIGVIDQGPVYAILDRLVKAGWAEFRQEGWDDLASPAHRCYRLTDAGRTRLLACSRQPAA